MLWRASDFVHPGISSSRIPPRGRNSNSEGKAIVSQLLTAAEDKRETLTVIFAGYKDDIETKLYSFNPGLKSRFKDVIFEDFTQPE